jgi:hypothetical protein
MLILIVLPGFSSMVPVARMAVRNLLPKGPRIDDAVLIVSEFTTNAVRHSTSRGLQFELSLDITPKRLRIEVRDGGPFGYPPPAPLAAPPFPLPPWTTLYEEDQQRDRAAELEEYRLGLALINAASDEWGTSRYPDHAVWWAELSWTAPARDSATTPDRDSTSDAASTPDAALSLAPAPASTRARDSARGAAPDARFELDADADTDDASDSGPARDSAPAAAAPDATSTPAPAPPPNGASDA